MKTTLSATQKIRNWLLSGKPLTPIQALEKWGCFRLGARVNDLRNEGYLIHTEIVAKNGKRFAKYSLL